MVVEVLLQRTRAAQVVPVYHRFLEEYPTARSFGSASLRDIELLIAPLGLKWRAPLLHALAREIGISNGRLPRDEARLKALPGVGSYASAAALSFHGGQRAVIVDANVVRVLARLVGRSFDAETRREAWLVRLADELTPTESADYGYAILDLAAAICLPRVPRCHRCPLMGHCATGSGETERER